MFKKKYVISNFIKPSQCTSNDDYIKNDEAKCVDIFFLQVSLFFNTIFKAT